MLTIKPIARIKNGNACCTQSERNGKIRDCDLAAQIQKEATSQPT
jgi:hypothetical protein